MKKIPMAFRLNRALIARAKATAKTANKTLTYLLERGLELATREQEKKNAR